MSYTALFLHAQIGTKLIFTRKTTMNIDCPPPDIHGVACNNVISFAHAKGLLTTPCQTCVLSFIVFYHALLLYYCQELAFHLWQLAKQIVNKQRVLMHRHQGLNVRHGLCHIYMRYLYIYELFIAFVCFVVCSLL